MVPERVADAEEALQPSGRAGGGKTFAIVLIALFALAVIAGVLLASGFGAWFGSGSTSTPASSAADGAQGSSARTASSEAQNAAASDGGDAGAQAAPAESQSVAPDPAPAESQSAAPEPAPAESTEQVAPEPASYDVVTKDFAFNIPDYWKGRVAWDAWEEGGYSKVVVYPRVALDALDEYYLVRIEAVDPAAPNNGGDYISHKIRTIEDAGKRVDVYSKNWPAYYAERYYSSPNYGGSSQEKELMAALTDLCCGGAYSLSDAYGAAQGASNPGLASSTFVNCDVDFLEAELVPSITIMHG